MKQALLSLIFLLLSAAAFSQEGKTQIDKEVNSVSNKLKISGYVQTQYQYGEKNASLKLGGNNENKEEAFNRIGIRRGRLKFVYDEGIASGVFQIDLTEKGLFLKDAYLNVKDPWLKSNALRVGVFDRPFGSEISYSSSRRESPERSTIFQTLFPNERDMGAMLHLQADKKSVWNFLTLQAGLFSGNAINKDVDNRKDFIGHLWGRKKWKLIEFGAGVSYYNGAVYQATGNVCSMKGKSFVVDDRTRNKGDFAKREYFGTDLQFAINTSLGATSLRAEYLFGQQPGTAESSKSPDSPSLPSGDTYLRDFSGAYAMLVQDIGTLPFAAVLKYDIYDPNTKLRGNEVGEENTTITDLMQHTLGFGVLWHIIPTLRLTAYYDVNRYEKTASLPDANDLKRDVFTLRLQYKF